jgi:hypothetical protein
MWFRKRNGKFDDQSQLGDEFGEELKVIVLLVDGHPIRAMHMSQMPIMRILPIMSEQDAMTQLSLLMNLLKDSLLDPADWETYLLPAKLESLGGVIRDWTETMDIGLGEERNGKNNRR